MNDPVDPTPLPPSTPSTPSTPPAPPASSDEGKPDPKDKLLSRQLQELMVKYGRLPTTNEAAAEMSRDRSVIASALRTMRLDVERRDQQAITALRTQVDVLTASLDDVLLEIQRQGALLVEHGRMLESARDASWRHRRDLVNARLALAVLARLTEVTDLDAERYGALVRSIRSGHFAPVIKGLPDGAEAKVLAGLLGVGSVAAVVGEIARREQAAGGFREAAVRAPVAGRPSPATPKSAAG